MRSSTRSSVPTAEPPINAPSPGVAWHFLQLAPIPWRDFDVTQGGDLRTDPFQINADVAGMTDGAHQQLASRLWAVDRVLVPGGVEILDGRIHTVARGWRWDDAEGALDRFCRIRNADHVAR